MSYSTTSASTITLNGIALEPQRSPDPARVPNGLIVTRAVQTKGGWIGQLIVDQDILWESEPMEKADEAEQAATARVVARIKKLLG